MRSRFHHNKVDAVSPIFDRPSGLLANPFALYTIRLKTPRHLLGFWETLTLFVKGALEASDAHPRFGRDLLESAFWWDAQLIHEGSGPAFEAFIQNLMRQSCEGLRKYRSL